MKVNKLKLIIFCAGVFFLYDISATETFSLGTLLESIKSEHQSERIRDIHRIENFEIEKKDHEAELKNIQLILAKEEKKAQSLEQTFNKNDKTIINLESALITRMGTLKELLGTIQQTTSATQAQFENSITQIEFPDRMKMLEDLRIKVASTKQLVSLNELENLWFELQREMTESSKIKMFSATVLNERGMEEKALIKRVGLFNLISEKKYLTYNPLSQKINILERQPTAKHLRYLEKFYGSTDSYEQFSIDPTRGQVLELLDRMPYLSDRVGQGGLIGYIIILLGLVGVLLGIDRFVSQITNPRPKTSNPLGRILTTYKSCRDADSETVELKLSEALLREIPVIKKRLVFLKTIAVVAPLLGLLGTVTGMIITFQSITLFGTGDPKLMASGISQALVTTALGLITAIPILLAHTMLGTRVSAISHLLEETVTSLIASHTMSKINHAGTSTDESVIKS
jgi:biopolymer transport protein ExbB